MASKASTTSDGSKGVALCASCDRCRARKTKCDGKRPCSNCAAKYMKKHRLTSIEGIDVALFECVYSPAKRRGPVPGKAGQVRKADELEQSNKRNGNLLDINNLANGGVCLDANALLAQQAQFNAMGLGSAMPFDMDNSGITGMGDGTNGNGMGNDPLAMQRQQLLMQQTLLNSMNNGTLSPNDMQNFQMLQQQMQAQQQQSLEYMQNQMRPPEPQVSRPRPNPSLSSANAATNTLGLAKSVLKHLPLLEKSSVDGNRLRSYYLLSIDTLLRLPPVPSDEEYCTKLGGTMHPSMLPPFDLAALRAARFSEIALGAHVGNQTSLALELSNATVTCLRQCVEDPIHPSCMYDVARAYFLHALFRSYRGDMVRYFKYRRVCLNHIAQMENVQGTEALIAAISFHDAWAYISYNANEEALPPIDTAIPPVPEIKAEPSTAAEIKYNTCTNPRAVVSDASNQNWIQGAPPVFINNEAPPLSRCLDALACSIRSCCDQANKQFSAAQEEAPISMTGLAVSANQDELCSRNMLLSAFTLVQQHEADANSLDSNQGHHLLLSAMDAFFEGGDEDESAGMSDSQIHSLLFVCNTIIESPMRLFQPGLTYHMVSNAAILLCHLLNGLYDKRDPDGLPPGEMEAALFDEVLDTYTSVRKLVMMHRSKLPPQLRCHGLPRPALPGRQIATGGKFIDMACVEMCRARGCQGFVLMGCSPCVAAERIAAAEKLKSGMDAVGELGEEDQLFQDELNELSGDFDKDDDALLSVLSSIIAS